MAESVSHRVDRNADEASEAAPALSDAEQARAVAEYLGDMIGQLESMVRFAGLDLLVYLLSMARVEAELNARDLAEKRHPTSG